MIKISVIVPVYNTEKYLKRCLDSILSQTLKEIEVIVVNDGSLDKSAEIIDEYRKKDLRLKVINKTNGGLSSARNVGIDASIGKYIVHIDSDDWIEKSYFEDMLTKAENEDLDIVVSDIFWDYDNGNIEYRKDLKYFEGLFVTGKQYLDMFFKGEIYPAVWNKMYKADLYKQNNIKHPVGISLGEDLGTTPLLASKAKKIGKINKAYVHYIQNIESITKSNPIKKINELILVFKILEEKLYLEHINLVDFNTIKITSLTDIILKSNFKFKDYQKVLDLYCSFFKKDIKYRGNSKKNKIYFRLLKSLPNIKVLILIYYFNKFGFNIKKITKKILKIK